MAFKQDLVIPQKCILLRSGSEIWLDAEKVNAIEKSVIVDGFRGFIKLTEQDRGFNTVDIVEFLTPAQMDDRARSRNGEWQCAYSNWHDRKAQCSCAFDAAKKKEQDEQREREASLLREKSPEEIARAKKIVQDTKLMLTGQMAFPKTPAAKEYEREAR